MSTRQVHLRSNILLFAYTQQQIGALQLFGVSDSANVNPLFES